MAYRTTEIEGAPRFSDRQLEWIRATSSEAEVAANLRGRSVTEAPRSEGADEVTQLLFWLALPCLALGGYAFYETRSSLSLIPGGLGVVLLAGALGRSLVRARARRAPPEIEIVTLLPTFEERVVEDAEGAQRILTYVKAREPAQGGGEMVWPSKLSTLSATLGAGEQLRVGVVRRGALRFIGWAHPV
jgi:hypothetical protein